MPRNEVDLTREVMEKIRAGEVKMRSRWYFVGGSAAMLVGVIAALVLAVFAVSLISFSLRTHGPMGSFRLQQILASFPWWAPILAIVGLGLGIWLLRRYDFSYKRNFSYLVAVALVAIILAGVAIDYLGLDDIWLKRGPMRQYMQQFGAGMGRGNNMGGRNGMGPGGVSGTTPR